MRAIDLSELGDDPVLDISSLIDVCFLLLIFFLVTATIQPREADLPIRIPGAHRDGPAHEVLMMHVGVRRDGAVVLTSGGGVEVLDTDVSQRELSGLKGRLDLFRALSESTGEEIVVRLNVDDGAEQQRFIDVINCFAGEGIGSIAMNFD